jgi:hypothetical protein
LIYEVEGLCLGWKVQVSWLGSDISHDAAAGHGEHELVGVFARDGCGQLGGQEPRQRDTATLTRPSIMD